MADFAGFSVDKFRRTHDLASEYLTYSLMTEADAQNRDSPGEAANGFERDAGAVRRSRPRRDEDTFGPIAFLNLVHAYLVIPANDDLLSQFAEILDKIVSE
jgi:hypothetical protein